MQYGFGQLSCALLEHGLLDELRLWVHPLFLGQATADSLLFRPAGTAQLELAPGWPVLVGASGMAATLLYFYATHVSMLATVAVLVSLYPGVTVLLARVLLHERFSPVQRAGLSLCTLAVVAIALS